MLAYLCNVVTKVRRISRTSLRLAYSKTLDGLFVRKRVAVSSLGDGDTRLFKRRAGAHEGLMLITDDN